MPRTMAAPHRDFVLVIFLLLSLCEADILTVQVSNESLLKE